MFLIILFLIIYWLYDKDKGLIIGYTLVSSFLINNFVKGLVNRRRPFEYEGHEYLRKLVDTSLKDGATGTSFPSGHSQIVQHYILQYVYNITQNDYLL